MLEEGGIGPTYASLLYERARNVPPHPVTWLAAWAETERLQDLAGAAHTLYQTSVLDDVYGKDWRRWNTKPLWVLRLRPDVERLRYAHMLG